VSKVEPEIKARQAATPKLVSIPRFEGEAAVVEGVNDECHSWRGHLDKHGGLVLGQPRVVAVYWDSFFTEAAQLRMNQFIRDIAETDWMAGLVQYGVHKLQLAGSFVIDDQPVGRLSRDQLEQRLIGWLDNGKIGVRPASRERSLLYVLFTPAETELTLNGLSSNTDFAGYHWWSRYHKSPIFTTENLFWAAIPMMPSGGRSFESVADSLTPVVSHEMAETFTDRNGDGFKAPNGCEIGDVCETQTDRRRGHWLIERYWSDVDQACVPEPADPLFQSFLLHTGTPIDAVDGAEHFAAWVVADYNGDGVPDLFGIKVSETGTGSVEVHVLDGASGYQNFLLQTGTTIEAVDGAEHFAAWVVADYNGDGVPDLFGIKVSETGTGSVEVHVLDGASGYQDFLLQTGTPIDQADGAQHFAWGIGERFGDGIPDLVGIKVREAATGTAEVHILDGASRYQNFLVQTGTPIDQADAGANLMFLAAPFNRNGAVDLFGIKTRNTGTGSVEVHILDGLADFASFALHTGTPIDSVDGANNFVWSLGDLSGDGVSDLFGIKIRNSGTASVEVHVLST